MRYDNSYQGNRYDESFETGLNNPVMIFVAGLATGAALMYFLDPERGRRRRALMMDQAVGLTNDARRAINATTDDLSNRAYGLYAETRRAVGSPIETGKENRSRTGQSNINQPDASSIDTEIGRSATQRS